MEIVDYPTLLMILKDLKMKNKRIGNFTTTGRLHQGHIDGIKRAREVSDIVIVFFAYYFKTIFLQLTGRNSADDYRGFKEDDLKLLQSTGLVDYVTFREYEPSIYEELLPLRKIAFDEYDNLLKERRIFIPDARSLNTKIAYLAMPLRMNPDEHFCETVWVGDKNHWFRVSELIARKHNIPVHYNYYPITRADDGFVLDSSTINCSPEQLIFKEDGKKFVDETISLVSSKGTIPDYLSSEGEPTEKQNRVAILLDEEMKKAERLQSGKNFFLYCSCANPQRRPYIDFIRITG